MESDNDAVATIALDLMARHGADAPQMVEQYIDDANARNDWGALNEWHRVRLRMKRLWAVQISAVQPAARAPDRNRAPSGF